MRNLLSAISLALFACASPAPPLRALRASTPLPAESPATRPPTVVAPDDRAAAASWRAAHRLVDLHTHIDPTLEHMGLAVRIFDAAGIGVAVNLSGGTTTHASNQASELENVKAFADSHFPGRFLEYMNLDYSGWDRPDFARQAVAQVEEGARLGAAGFKEFKRLGLYLRDRRGRLLAIDDAKLDPMWRRLGELGMPVSIHVADPRAFWEPYDEHNERWNELKGHPRWWFGDSRKFPPRLDLLAALERVIARHPETTFVCVHMGNDAEDLDWVDAQLDAHPNMRVDIAARIPEFGRQDPEKVRAFFVKHADRIFFATDFQVYDRMTLGSGGNGPVPTERDAIDFYEKHWRFLETADLHFAHMTPIQGDWTISGIHLPDDVLRKVYFENAEKLLARPLAVLARP